MWTQSSRRRISTSGTGWHSTSTGEPAPHPQPRKSGACAEQPNRRHSIANAYQTSTRGAGMTSRLFRSFAAAYVAAFTCILPNGAVAAQTITSGDQVVRAMHDRYQSTWYHTLTFTQKTTRRTPADTMVVETWYESAAVPGRLRIDIAPRPGGRSIIFANDSIFVTRGDSVLRRVAGRNPLLILGFDVYGQSAERTMEVLRAEGFNLAPVHEDTWKGRKVYVVGANAGDLHSKQFWV